MAYKKIFHLAVSKKIAAYCGNYKSRSLIYVAGKVSEDNQVLSCRKIYFSWKVAVFWKNIRVALQKAAIKTALKIALSPNFSREKSKSIKFCLQIVTASLS